MSRHIVPDLVSGQVLTILPPAATVEAAAKAMASRNIGAVIIADEGHLLGIFTERDLVRRVVALGRDARSTPLELVMTSDLATVSPDDEPERALDLMRRTGCRHLPVLDGERIVGVLSIRDLYAMLERDLANRGGEAAST
jgi:CBS domain-containing protein